MKHDIPLPLVKKLSRGNCTIFVGAGLSIPAELPSWPQLVARLKAGIRDCPEGSSPTDVAEFYEVLHEREGLVRALLEAIPADAKPTPSHRHLLALRPQRVFTTNYDLLLEAAAREAGTKYAVLRTNALPTDGDEADLQIIKVHGDIAEPEQMVITSSNYYDFQHERRGLAGLLKAHLQYHASLFLGYGFGDPNLKMLLSDIRRESPDERPTLYSLQLKLKPIIRKWFEKQDIHVIELPAEPGTRAAVRQVEGWLAALADEVAKERTTAERKASLVPPLGRLPARERRFMRHSDMVAVLRLLKQEEPVVVITGYTGMGKSNLAKEVGHCCLSTAEHPIASAPAFDHVVWVSAKDRSLATAGAAGPAALSGRNPWLELIFNAIETVTGVRAAGRVRGRGPASGVQFRALLAAEPTLLILDNFETVKEPALERWLRTIPSPSRALITTSDPHSFQGALRMTLSGLEPDDAVRLLEWHCLCMGLEDDLHPGQAKLRRLATTARGNPELMRMALGQYRSRSAMSALRQWPEENVEPALEGLLNSAWERMDEDARAVLCVTALFTGLTSIRADALQAAAGLGRSAAHFKAALRCCLGFGLLEVENEAGEAEATRYRVHPFTLAFAQSKLAKTQLGEAAMRPGTPDARFEIDARRRIGDYYLELVRSYIERKNPPVPYWNALVHDGMDSLDPEWPALRQVLDWELSARPALMVELTRLLVHYMDSRFLNEDRKYWVVQAIHQLEQFGSDRELAVMKIDALSWTLIEEDQRWRADKEIVEGMKIAKRCASPDKEDLLALGYAWRARIHLEEHRTAEAKAHISEAFKFRCRPWIEMRVLMVFGDIALDDGEPENALAAYRHAQVLAENYGGEGHGYQTLPRIGFAYVQTGQYDEAEQTFRELAATPRIAIGSLYAAYGLAMLAHKRGKPGQAHDIIESLKANIPLQESNNLLSRMIGTLYETIRMEGEAAG